MPFGHFCWYVVHDAGGFGGVVPELLSSSARVTVAQDGSELESIA